MTSMAGQQTVCRRAEKQRPPRSRLSNLWCAKRSVLTGEGTGLRHKSEGEIDLADAHDT